MTRLAVLAFGRAIKLKVKLEDHQTAAFVTVTFCGTPDAPLLVQRTDVASAEEEAGTSGVAGSSGTAACPGR